MKPSTVFSLLAVAYATTVVAVPTPEVSIIAPAKRGLMFGPFKSMLGLEGGKRDVEEHSTVSDEKMEKRGLMFGPFKSMLGLEGGKRDVDEHEDIDEDEDVEKRGLMFGPFKSMLGLEGGKRDVTGEGGIEASNGVREGRWPQKDDA